MQKKKENESKIMKKNQEELELEEILRELEKDERLKDITVPETVIRNLDTQIAAYEAAVSEIEPIEVTKTRIAEIDKMSLEERFPNMTREERIIFQEAMEAKKAQDTKENHREEDSIPIQRKGKKRGTKLLILVAAVLVLTLGVGMVSVGTEYKWLDIWGNQLVKDVVVAVESEDDKIVTTELSEKEAYAYAKELFQTNVVTMGTSIENLRYDTTQMLDELSIIMIYQYNGYIIQYNIYQNLNKITHFEIQTGELQEEYVVNYSGVDITVQKYVEENENLILKGSFTYGNLFYSISGSVSEDEFLEMLDNLYFY